MLIEIVEHAARGDSFAFETTLAGRVYVRFIREWRANGYYVTLLFLSLETAEQAIVRVAARVAQGGHGVPEEVVKRRFVAGLHNFETIYRHEVDRWRRYDNSGEVPMLIDESENR